jgi:hypothetical protein
LYVRRRRGRPRVTTPRCHLESDLSTTRETQELT